MQILIAVHDTLQIFIRTDRSLNTRHVTSAVAVKNKKAVLSQGNRAMPQQNISV